MGKMYLFQELAQFRGKFLQHILSSHATECDGGSVTRMGQVYQSPAEGMRCQ